MNRMRRGYLVLGILVGSALGSRPSMAQSEYTADYQTNIISGVVSNWAEGPYSVGYTNSADVLLIQNGGVLSDGNADLGYKGSNNVALVTGSGSVWSNGGMGELRVGTYSAGNQLIISNGGAVFNNNAYLGFYSSSSNNMVSVTGTGSVWSSSDMYISTQGAGNQLVVSMGGTVYSGTTRIGSTVGTKVVVSDPGSDWISTGSILVSGSGGSVFVGSSSGSSFGGGNTQYDQLIVTNDGELRVTNNIGGGRLAVNGTFSLDSGTVTVDSLQVNGNGVVTFNDGVLNTKTTHISNGSGFTVGNGTNVATLTLASGGSGFHFFAKGLTISSNATLSGVGTISGATTVNGGGVLAPGDGPGSITFNNSLTLAPGSTFAIALNGTGAGQYSQIIELGGTVSVSNCVLSVSLGYTPSPGDSFTIISNLTSMAVLGTFVTTSGVALPNGADFVVDNTTFQIDYAANADGLDVDLTAFIPEPSAFLLAALGGVSLAAFLRRKRA